MNSPPPPTALTPSASSDAGLPIAVVERETGIGIVTEVLDTENLALVLNDLPAIQSLPDPLPAKPFPVLAIHDAFACHPNYGNDVRRQYNRILHDIGASEMLASVVSDIAGQPTQVHKRTKGTEIGHPTLAYIARTETVQ